MERTSFERKVAALVARDTTYHAEAYLLVREALACVLGEVRKRNDGQDRHISGGELVDGFRRLALRRFGPMAHEVLGIWGVRATRDVGDIVFRLIDAGLFGRAPDDKPEDFDDLFDFHEAFVEPFRPRSGGSARDT